MCIRIAPVLVAITLAPFVSFGPGGRSDQASAAVQVAAAPSVEQRQNPNADRPGVPVTKDFDAFDPPVFGGKVVALTKDGVTIKPEGAWGSAHIVCQPDGTMKEVCRYIQDDTQPPRTFVFTEDMLYQSGLNPTYRGPGAPYLWHPVTDVKIGDTVEIGCVHTPAKVYCTRITIKSRPDAQVPPTILEKRHMERHGIGKENR